MSVELLYTSAPQGLKQGSRGFSTVLCTSGLPINLATRLEGLSGYRHVFPPNHAQASSNPICYSHLRFVVGGRSVSILSRISDYGIDYSQRTNKLAHHIVVDTNEQPAAGPAWLLSQPGFMRTNWDGSCQTIPTGPAVPQADQSASICHTWHSIMGDAGWGGVLADHFMSNTPKPLWIVYKLEQSGMLLKLIDEAVALLPTNERWRATFSTYATSLPPEADCKVRCVLDGSDEARQAKARGSVIDIGIRTNATDETEAIFVARGASVRSETINVQTLPSYSAIEHADIRYDTIPNSQSAPPQLSMPKPPPTFKDPRFIGSPAVRSSTVPPGSSARSMSLFALAGVALGACLVIALLVFSFLAFRPIDSIAIAPTQSTVPQQTSGGTETEVPPVGTQSVEQPNRSVVKDETGKRDEIESVTKDARQNTPPEIGTSEIKRNEIEDKDSKQVNIPTNPETSSDTPAGQSLNPANSSKTPEGQSDPTEGAHPKESTTATTDDSSQGSPIVSSIVPKVVNTKIIFTVDDSQLLNGNLYASGSIVLPKGTKTIQIKESTKSNWSMQMKSGSNLGFISSWRIEEQDSKIDSANRRPRDSQTVADVRLVVKVEIKESKCEELTQYQKFLKSLKSAIESHKKAFSNWSRMVDKEPYKIFFHRYSQLHKIAKFEEKDLESCSNIESDSYIQLNRRFLADWRRSTKVESELNIIRGYEDALDSFTETATAIYDAAIAVETLEPLVSLFSIRCKFQTGDSKPSESDEEEQSFTVVFRRATTN